MEPRASESVSKQDYLGFASSKDTAGLIEEAILFSDKIKKINSWNMTQQRLIVITSMGVYNVDGNKIKRRLDLKSISGISKTTQPPNLNEFVVHVPDEYDYRYQAESPMRREEVIGVLKKQFVAQFKKNLPIYGIKAADLKEVTTTEADAKKKKSRIPDASYIIVSENLIKDSRRMSKASTLPSNALSSSTVKSSVTTEASESSAQDRQNNVRQSLFIGGALAASQTNGSQSASQVQTGNPELLKQNKKLESQNAMLKAQLESNAGGNATQIESLNEKNQRMTAQIAELEQQVKESSLIKEQVDQLDTENNHLKSKVNDLEQQLQDSVVEHSTMMEAKDAELADDRSKKVALETENIKLKADLEKSLHESKDNKTQVDILQAKVDEVQLELKLKGSDAADHSTFIDEKYQKDIDRMSQNIARLQADLEDEKSRSREAAELMSKNTMLQTAVVQKDQTIENANDKLGEKDAQINVLQGKISELELRNDQLNTQLTNKNQEIDRVQREKERKQIEFDEQSEELIKVKGERQVLLDQSVKKSQNSRQESEQKNAQLQIKIQELNDASDEQTAKLKLKDDQLHQKEEELIESQNKVKDLQGKITMMKIAGTANKSKKHQEMIYAKDEFHRKSIADFQAVKQIGKGCYGDVILVDDNTAQAETNYAMKCIKKDQICDCKQAGDLMSQDDILCKIETHPFIVEREYVFQKNDKLFILSEFMRGGTLFHHLLEAKRFHEDLVRFIAAQIAMALGHLHQNDIIYKDLKSENILVQDNGYVKLADFGLSKFMKDRKPVKNQRVSIEYCAPELLTENKRIDKAVDWWALGCVIYELLIGVPPFFAKDKLQLLFKIKESPLCFPNSQKSGIMISDSCKSFICSLMMKNRKQRLGSKKDVEEVLSHPWLNYLDMESIKNMTEESPFKPVVDDSLKYFDQRIVSDN